MKINVRWMAAGIVSAAMLVPGAVNAEETKPFYVCTYYSDEGTLMDVKQITDTPSEEELEILLDLYMPENTAKAKLYRWDTYLRPIEPTITGDPSNKHNITIINTNDMHGSLVSSSSVIGVDKIAALKNMTDNAILIDAGDAIQGVAFATLSNGADVIKAMNITGYNAMALGNHEFDYGIEMLKSNIDLAGFPVMSANTYQNGGLFTDANTIIEAGGYDVGIFALTTTSTMTSTSPKNIEGITFADEIETARTQIKELEEKGADVIVALTHMGDNEKVNCTSTQLASALADSGLDLIIDGHSHSEINMVQNGITIVQAGTANAKVGYVGINIDENGAVSADATLLSHDFFDNITADSTVTEQISEMLAEQETATKEVIARSDSTFWGGLINRISEARIHETNMGNLICDSMIDAVKAALDAEHAGLPVAAVENGGGFSGSFAIGDVTAGDVINALPYANTVMYKEVTPKVIYEMLEQSVSYVHSQDAETGMLNTITAGSYLQVGGMRFEYDPNGTEGSKVRNVYLDGQDTPISRTDDTTKIILASNDYVMEGGGYTMLSELPLLGEGGGLAKTLMDYVSELTSDGAPLSYPVTDGRIRTVGSYTPKDYTANVYIKDQAGNAVSDTEILYYIDGSGNYGVTDKDGILHPVVSDGAHGISLDQKTEIYVNNYSGNGIVEIDGSYPIYYPTLIMN